MAQASKKAKRAAAQVRILAAYLALLSSLPSFSLSLTHSLSSSSLLLALNSPAVLPIAVADTTRLAPEEVLAVSKQAAALSFARARFCCICYYDKICGHVTLSSYSYSCIFVCV